MKKLAILALGCLGLLMLAQAPLLEGVFTVPVNQWFGLDTDEAYTDSPNKARDMMNFDIEAEGGRTFLQQRQGVRRVWPVTPSAGAEIKGMFLCQINSDTERIVIGSSNGVIYTTGGGGGTKVWSPMDDGAGGRVSDYMSFCLFKDTLLIASGDSIFTFAKRAGSPGIFFVNNGGANPTGMQRDVKWPYRRIFLHQDRVYGFGVVDSTCNKLAWRPEFDIDFDSIDYKWNSGYVYIDKDDGDCITAALPMANHIIVYKSRSIYRVLISPSTNAPNEVVRVSENVGAYGYDAVTEYNGVHYFVAQDGVYSFDGVNVTKLSREIDHWFADSIVQSTGQSKVFKLAVANNRLYCTLPLRSVSQSADVGDYRHFVYDFDLKTWWKYDFGSTPTPSLSESHYMTRYEISSRCTALFGNSAKLFGQYILFVMDSSAGDNDLIHLFPYGWKDRDNDSIVAYYETPYILFGDTWQRKQLTRMFAFTSSGPASHSFTIDWYGESSTDTLARTTILTGSTPVLRNYRISPRVQGSLLRYKIRTSGGAVKINAMEFDIAPKGVADETEP